MITLSDLECDYLNAQQCCSRLNAVLYKYFSSKYSHHHLFLLFNNNICYSPQWVIPKMLAHTILLIFLLINGQWILSLVNLPMTIWLLYEIFTTPKGNMGVYDPTEIHNRGQLKRHMRDCMIYLGYYLIFFFIYLYWWA